MSSLRSRSERESKVVESFSTDDFASLPSKQTWEVLTKLLYWSVLPLAKNTAFILDICFLLIQSTTDKRRKISIYEADKCLVESFSLIFQPPEKALRTIIFDMGIERWVISNLVQNYLQGEYCPKLSRNSEFSEDQLHRHVNDMYAYYLSFRDDVCRRFMKLSNSQAAKNKWQKEQFGLISDLGDNENNYFLSVLRAIDKLYPTRGTLANYVNLWLGNAAGSNFTLYLGEAFNLSRPVRQMVHEGQLHVNNKSYGLEKAEHVPIEEHIADRDSRLNIVDIMEKVQRIPEVSLIYNLYDLPKYSAALNLQINIKLQEEGYPPITLPVPDVYDLPDIKPLARSSRKESETSNRRRELLQARKRNA